MWCPLKKYSDIFGKPNEGVHSHRFLGIAIVDLILTLIFACIISWVTKIPVALVISLLLTLAFILHLLFGVNTGVIKYLDLSC